MTLARRRFSVFNLRMSSDLAIERRAQEAMACGTINNYAIGLANGRLETSLSKPILAAAILEVALSGGSRVMIDDQMWVVWTDGQNSVAVGVTSGSSQSKSAHRNLRRMIKYLYRTVSVYDPENTAAA